MPVEDSIQRAADATTTRRTIVRTGAKLAYAAPVVAVSMKLNTAGATKISPVDFCGHSVGINGGCMPACTSNGFTGKQCGKLCGDGQSEGGCPVGQGNDNPCCNVGYCDPRNFVEENGEVVYVGPTDGCKK